MRCMRPAWRISTYSSRLEPVIARNLTRSRTGLAGSSASSRTRRLNCIHEKSLPLNIFCFSAVRAIESVQCAVFVSLSRLGAGGYGFGCVKNGLWELIQEDG